MQNRFNNFIDKRIQEFRAEYSDFIKSFLEVFWCFIILYFVLFVVMLFVDWWQPSGPSWVVDNASLVVIIGVVFIFIAKILNVITSNVFSSSKIEAEKLLAIGEVFDGLIFYEKSNNYDKIKTYLEHSLKVPNVTLQILIGKLINELLSLKRKVFQVNSRYVSEAAKEDFNRNIINGLHTLYGIAEHMHTIEMVKDSRLSQDKLNEILQPHEKKLQRLIEVVEQASISIFELVATSKITDLQVNKVISDFDNITEVCKITVELQKNAGDLLNSTYFSNELLQNSRIEESVKIPKRKENTKF